MIGADGGEYLPWLMCMAVGTGVMDLFCAGRIWGCSRLCVLSPMAAVVWSSSGLSSVALIKSIFRVFSEKITK